jgi:A/G-specific adenine glycosylase
MIANSLRATLYACAVAPASVNKRDRAIVDALLAWFEENGRDWPWRASRDRWVVLVSEVCLQQTQVSRAATYVEAILARFPTYDDLATADLGELLAMWQGLGYPRRARNLWLAAQALRDAGDWPDDYTTLPGVGPYTDAALRCFADEEAIVPPDINTRRVLARAFPEGAPTAATLPLLRERAWTWGQAVMELGQTSCRAKAQCDMCPLEQLCPSAGTEEVIASPRQKRFAGSMRQRRGVLLKAIAEAGFAVRDSDRDAADSLIADGLASLDPEGDLLLHP